ncbi:hypothetical protein HPB48_001635 [Haemaphysalis longicornis]|uniref:FP protein C-terminal domain-containing protein n=1 Tax=Haemaphysalis longicornis TaxID=44386 RepID=A0A9J6FXK4_HAELO|nr:hypothetical protein HPB48_001635 [Haemaphysalis longicornis]
MRIMAARGAHCSKAKTREGTAFEKILAEINAKLAQIPEIQSKVDALMLMKETVDKVEHSVQHLSDQYDAVLAGLKQQSSDITALKQRVEKIESRNDSQEVHELKLQLNRLEQYSRQQNIELHGLPLTENENLLEKLNKIAADLYLAELTPSDVEGLHRLPPKPDKAPAVLVRFVSRVTRNDWMAKKAELRAANTAVHFLDNLTSHNKALLWMMKAKAQEKHYQFAWQKEGKLFVRKATGARVVQIECEADLDKIR